MRKALTACTLTVVPQSANLSSEHRCRARMLRQTCYPAWLTRPAYPCDASCSSEGCARHAPLTLSEEQA